MPITLGMATSAWNANSVRVRSSIISGGIIATKEWVLISAALIKQGLDQGYSPTRTDQMLAVGVSSNAQKFALASAHTQQNR
jgi:hypothetical protein